MDENIGGICMTNFAPIKVGDLVDYYGDVCEVISVSKRSAVITIKRRGNRPYIARVYAWVCRKVGQP